MALVKCTLNDDKKKLDETKWKKLIQHMGITSVSKPLIWESEQNA